MLLTASSPEPRRVRSRASPPPLVALSPPAHVRRTLASDTAGLAEAEQLDVDVLAFVVRALWLSSPSPPRCGLRAVAGRHGPRARRAHLPGRARARGRAAGPMRTPWT